MHTSIILFLLFIYVLKFYQSNGATFRVDYPNKQFLKDGKSFRYISAEMHYFRVHQDLWNDRLQRIRAAGLNAVQTYVPWNLHEPFPGKFDFSDGINITRFLTLAQQNGLYVLLRAGPFIAAEWEFGGLPWWLLNLNISKLRSSDPNYLNAVLNFYETFLPVVKTYIYQNGGPILMVSLENEYGNPGCDYTYTYSLRDQFRRILGNDTVLFTNDQPNTHALTCGHVNETFATVDCSPQAPQNFSEFDTYFELQQKINSGGPGVCSEFYPGWFVNWNQSTPHPRPYSFVDNLSYMYSKNASFNIYMFHGGTNFEFQNGAGSDASIITSYDYGAPISENGAITELYEEIRKFIQNLTDWETPPQEIPKNNTAANYGQVTLQKIGTNLVSTLATLEETCYHTIEPMSFEQMGHPYGFVLYTTTITFSGKILSTPNLRDYAYVFLNNIYQGMLINMMSELHQTTLTLTNAQPGDILRILVENRSRHTWGIYFDSKGLHNNVTLDNKLQDLKSPKKSSFEPSVYLGQFEANVIEDTFFNPAGWSKGQLFINGYNIGRYWPIIGPQITLYVPSSYIKAKNTVLLIELNGAEQNFVNFIDHPIFIWRNNTF